MNVNVITKVQTYSAEGRYDFTTATGDNTEVLTEQDDTIVLSDYADAKYIDALDGNDTLDLSDLLHLSDGDKLSDYLDFETVDGDTIISFHADDESANITQTIILDGVDLGSEEVTIVNTLLTGTNDESALFIGDGVSVDSATMEITIPDDSI